MSGDVDRYELVIVGGGNMGAALAGGLLAAGSVAPSRLAVSEVSAERRAELANLVPGVAVTAQVPPCRAAVLAVKPADTPAAAAAAAAAGAERILSIAAGVPIGVIEQAIDHKAAVVRAMPNTPALVGEGASALAGGSLASEDDVGWAQSILAAVGLAVRVEESQLDAVTALSGSGPAYVFYVAEALVDAAVAAGLARDLADRLTSQLLVGSAKLLAERGDPTGLRAMVTSPGGTTAAGIAELERHGVREAFGDAVVAAARRSRELAAGR
jgi:pyrroline-5-carboxylate reductase